MRIESDGRGGVLVRPARADPDRPDVFWGALEAAVDGFLGGGERPQTPVLVRIQGAPPARPPGLRRLRKLHAGGAGLVFVWLPPPLAGSASRPI